MSIIIGNTVGTPMNPQKFAESGKSAYDIAVKNGFMGTEAEWLASLVGAPGKDGVTPTIESYEDDGFVEVTIYYPLTGDGVSFQIHNGKTPYIKDGYWYIDGVNTNVKAQGVDGKDGTNGKDGANGADGKDGTNGNDGYTPVKGVDYYTTADKTELVNMVLAALPAAEGGSF
jgi:hypothetical protein